MNINKRKTKELVNKDKLPNHTHRRNRHSASNRGEDTWHYHHQQPALGRNVDEITRKAGKNCFYCYNSNDQDSRQRPSDGIYNGGPAPTLEYHVQVWATSLTFGAPKWKGGYKDVL
ncbi:hypothetical protein NP493_6227g00001 [Ridgeia piscesae]|uniref:Uncharacterized protein n=1 Tax=Ridgeia piscesae TaxID=27915 RepID=A0AAD9MPS9_RIDPI|nr:hypothetical protein NP493_6227g00001 [Ridgeia piscesae]